MKNKKLMIIIGVIIVLIAIILGIMNNAKKEKKEEVEGKNISEKEIETFNNFFNEESNNGFLLSEYDTPNEINLNLVLYNGAGIGIQLTDEEKENYDKYMIENNILFGGTMYYTVIKKKDIEDLFFQKTGEQLQNIDKKLADWVYVTDYDTYYRARGKSNYTKAECLWGTKKDDKYEIKVRLKNSNTSNTVTVTLKKQGDNFLFVSNKSDNISTTTESQTEAQEQMQTEEKEEGKGNLTSEELSKITSFLEEIENNGFVISEYNNANEIDLDKVLYSGANINKEITDEERKVFYEKIGKEDYQMNVFCIEEEKIAELFKQKTGEELTNIEERLKNWTYLPEYKEFCSEHSDTSYTTVECVEGKKEGENITVKLNLENSEINQTQLTLKEQGDSYIFVSNKKVE